MKVELLEECSDNKEVLTSVRQCVHHKDVLIMEGHSVGQQGEDGLLDALLILVHPHEVHFRRHAGGTTLSVCPHLHSIPIAT